MGSDEAPKIDGPGEQAWTVDDVPTIDGGREYARTVQCGHCGSDESLSGLEGGAGNHRVWMTYRCGRCRRFTYLTAFTGDGGRVYITRVRPAGGNGD